MFHICIITLSPHVCPSPHLPDVAKNVLVLFAIVHVSEITWKTVGVTIQSHVTPAASGSSVQCLITYAINPIVSYCSKSVKPDHQSFIEVNTRSNVKSWKYVFYDFECTQNTIDTETKRPVHEVNYCIAMSISDKCPDDGSCDDCLPVHTFSGLGGKNALDKFCKWAFDHPVNEGAVFIAHNSNNYDAHFLLSYLIRNGAYPEILANGTKLLELKINTRNAKLIDSRCFIAMPFTGFSDT